MQYSIHLIIGEESGQLSSGTQGVEALHNLSGVQVSILHGDIHTQGGRNIIWQNTLYISVYSYIRIHYYLMYMSFIMPMISIVEFL